MPSVSHTSQRRAARPAFEVTDLVKITQLDRKISFTRSKSDEVFVFPPDFYRFFNIQGVRGSTDGEITAQNAQYKLELKVTSDHPVPCLVEETRRFRHYDIYRKFPNDVDGTQFNDVIQPGTRAVIKDTWLWGTNVDTEIEIESVVRPNPSTLKNTVYSVYSVQYAPEDTYVSRQWISHEEIIGRVK